MGVGLSWYWLGCCRRLSVWGEDGAVVVVKLVGRWVERRGGVGFGLGRGVWGVTLEINTMLRGKQGIGIRVLGVGAGE